VRIRLHFIVIYSILCAAPLLAHHAFSGEFDANKPVKLKGVVSLVEWTNPHTRIDVSVTDADGKITRWTIQGGSPSVLGRGGVTSQSLRVGMEVLIDAYQAKDGSFRASGRDITLADGRKLSIAQ
jgi:hypothetical protein